MTAETLEKLLSVCMCGRDDDYMLDFAYRTATTLNQLASYLVDLGREDEVEVVFTDWGSAVPLANGLQLSKAAAALCRFIYVSPETVEKSQGGSKSFHTARAVNAAIRRSRGSYVLVSNPDQLVTRAGLDALLRMLRGDLSVPADVANSLMLVPRVQVPWQFVQRQPDLGEWEHYLFHNEFALGRESIALQHCAGASGGLMMRGDLYRSLRGLDERHSGWGWSDIDLGMRALQSHSVFWLSAIGMSMFHMGHAPSGRRRDGLVAPNEPAWSLVPEVNDDTWGLNRTPLEEMHSTAGVEGDRRVATGGPSDPRAHPPKAVTREDFLKKSVLEGTRSIVGRLSSRGWPVPSERIHALLLVAWYAFERFPRRCVVFGIGEGLIAELVASACPSTEIYGVDRWEGVVEGNPALRLAHDLVDFGHQGRVHYVNGEPSTAVSRLRKAYGEDFRVDFVTLSGNSAGPDGAPALQLLAPGGAMMIESGSPETVDSLWHVALRDRPDWTWTLATCNQGRSGLILNSPSAPGILAVHRELSLEFDVKWWDRILRDQSREASIVRRVFRRFLGGTLRR